MIVVLEHAEAGRALYSDCEGMSQHGGRLRTVAAMKRRCWLDQEGQLTSEGREALAKARLGTVNTGVKPTHDQVWSWVNKPESLRPPTSGPGRYSRPLSARDDVIATALGQEVRRLRTQIGMSTRELGAILGMSQPSVSKLERNDGTNIELRLIWDLASAFDVPIGHFIDVCQRAVDSARAKHFASPHSADADVAISTV